MVHYKLSYFNAKCIAEHLRQTKILCGRLWPISKVKVEPKEEEFGGLRLSSLSRPSEDGDDEESKTELREQRLVSLNSMQMERFKIQKKKLEAAFKNDCETFVFVTQKLLAKDESLEQSLRMALIENMEDLEKQMMEKVDSYLAANC